MKVDVNRFDRGPKRKEYDPNKNYDHDIFNIEKKAPEYRSNKFNRNRQASTEISERRIEHKLREVSPFVNGHRNQGYVSNNFLTNVPYADNTYKKENLAKSLSQPHFDNTPLEEPQPEAKCQQRRGSCDKENKLSQSVIVGGNDDVEEMKLPPQQKSEKKNSNREVKNAIITENPRVTKHLNSNTAVEIEDRYLKPEKNRYLYHTKDNYNLSDNDNQLKHCPTQPELSQEEKKAPDNITNKDGFALVCLNCLNRKLCEDHKAKKKEEEDARKNPQTSNRNNHMTIEDFKAQGRKKLLQERENKASEAGNAIQPVEEKENFANKCAAKENALNDNNKKDFYKEKAKNRDKELEKFGKTYRDQFEIGDSKPRVNEYYRNVYE